MRICFNDGWKYYKTNEEENCKTVRLPHTELLYSKKNISLYRKEFDYQEAFKNKRIFLCGRIKENSTVHLNGKEVLRNDNNCFELTRLLKKENNVLELKTEEYLNDEVYLEIKDKTFISDVSFLQKYEEGNYILNCHLKYDGKLNGYESVKVKLLNKESEEVFSTSFSALLKEYSFNVGRVNEWSKFSPYLYTVEFNLNGSIYSDQIGFRHFSLRDGNLFFNEEAFKGLILRYENIHPYVYNLVNRNLIEDDLKKLHSLNTDIIKVDSPDETLLDFCDSLGLMVACKESLKDHSCIVFKLSDNKLLSKDSGDIYPFTVFERENPYASLHSVYNRNIGLIDLGAFCDNEYSGTKGIFDFMRNRKKTMFNDDDSYRLYYNGRRYLINGDFSYLKLYHEDEYIGTYKPDKYNLAVIDDIADTMFKKKYEFDDKKFAALMTVLNHLHYYKSLKMPLFVKLQCYFFKKKYKLNNEQLKELYDEYHCLNISDNVKFEIYKDERNVKTIKKKKQDNYHFELEVSDNVLIGNQIAIVRLKCLNEDNELIPDFEGLVKAVTKGRISMINPHVCTFKNGVSTFYIHPNGLRGKGTLMIDVSDSHFELEFSIKK